MDAVRQKAVPIFGADRIFNLGRDVNRVGRGDSTSSAFQRHMAGIKCLWDGPVAGGCRIGFKTLAS